MRGPLLAGGSSANSEIITPSIPSRLWRNENERGGRGGEEGMHEMKGRGERALRSKAGDEKGMRFRIFLHPERQYHRG